MRGCGELKKPNLAVLILGLAASKLVVSGATGRYELALPFNAALRFARVSTCCAQSSRDPIPEQLQRLHPTELLQMAALDTLHTLLALDGAAGLPGTMQAVLLQAAWSTLVAQ